MSQRDHSRPLVQFRPDESPTWRKQNQIQSNGFFYFVVFQTRVQFFFYDHKDVCSVEADFQTSTSDENVFTQQRYTMHLLFQQTRMFLRNISAK